MQDRRNLLIRSIAGLCGDIAVGIAIASACSWCIQAASLGLFLAFLLWVLAAIAALWLSQTLVHPAVNLLLTDKKLDAAMESLSATGQLIDVAGAIGMAYAQSLWSRMRPVNFS